MHYISTRGHDEPLSFTDAMMRGLAPDGGLYVPETIPSFSKAQMSKMAACAYLPLAGLCALALAFGLRLLQPVLAYARNRA